MASNGSDDRKGFIWVTLGVLELDFWNAIVDTLGVEPLCWPDYLRSVQCGTFPSIRNIGLIYGTSIDTDDLIAAFVECKKEGISFGIFPCTSVYAISEWLNKTVSVLKNNSEPFIRVDPSKVTISVASFPQHCLQSAPRAYLRMHETNSIPDIQRDILKSDFLMLAGHSNQVDGAFGHQIIACSRIGYSTDPEGKNFPCHYDGKCFRQIDHGRDPMSQAGMIDFAQIKAQIVTLSGCNVVTGKSTWFNPVNTLLDRLSHSSVVVAIGSFGTTSHSVEADLILLASLAEGHTLAEACSRTNHYLKEIAQSTGMPMGIGPLCVIGDPRTTVQGIPIYRVSFETGTSKIKFNMKQLGQQVHLGFFACLEDLAQLNGIRTLAVFSENEIWVRCVRRPEGGIYLWICPQTDSPQLFDVTVTEYIPGTKRSTDWLYEAEWCSNWSSLLTEISKYLFKKSGESDSLDRLIMLHESLKDDIFSLISQIRARESHYLVLSCEKDVTAINLEKYLAQLDEVRITVLAFAINYIGTRIFHLWVSSGWEPIEIDEITDIRCLCGGTLYSTVYRRFIQGGEREVASCPVCGPVLEGPIFRDAYNMKGRSMDATLEQRIACRGTDISWNVRNLHPSKGGVAVAVIQDVNRIHQIVSDSIFVDSKTSAELSVTIPTTLTPGAYPAAVIASFGGELTIRRDMINVSFIDR